MRTLVIEDDPNIARLLRAGLESEYFVVDTASDGEEGSYLARTNEYDIIILDVMLPKKDGLHVCTEIRSSQNLTPIIILSVESGLRTKVELLNAGADDYLTKPFSFEELIARIHALLRRPHSLDTDTLHIEDITMDIRKHEVHKDGQKVLLTKNEFMLLELLLRRKGTVVSRGTILEHVWDMNVDPFSNTIESHILNLRKKLSDGDKASRTYIHTIPSVGYKIE